MKSFNSVICLKINNVLFNTSNYRYKIIAIKRHFNMYPQKFCTLFQNHVVLNICNISLHSVLLCVNNFILTLLNENVTCVIHKEIIRSNNYEKFTCSSCAWAPELLEAFTFLCGALVECASLLLVL